MLAVSLVGKYLLSGNLATMLVFFTEKSTNAGWDDTIVVLLLLFANLVLWSPIKAELLQV